MKNLVLVLVLVLVCLAFSSAAFAKNGFVCATSNFGTSESGLAVSAEGQGEYQLRDVVLEHKSSWNVSLRLPIVQRNEVFKPKNPAYQGLHKYVVDVPNGPDCSWTLLIPPAPTASLLRPIDFRVIAQIACDSSFITRTLKCEAKQ